MPRREPQVLHDGEVVEQLRLVGHEREPPLRLDGVRDDVVPADRDCAAGRALDADDAAKRGRLAGAVRADEADDLSRPRREREVVHGGEGAVALGEVRDVDHTMPAIGSADDESDDYVISAPMGDFRVTQCLFSTGSGLPSVPHATLVDRVGCDVEERSVHGGGGLRRRGAVAGEPLGAPGAGGESRPGVRCCRPRRQCGASRARPVPRLQPRSRRGARVFSRGHRRRSRRTRRRIGSPPRRSGSTCCFSRAR